MYASLPPAATAFRVVRALSQMESFPADNDNSNSGRTVTVILLLLEHRSLNLLVIVNVNSVVSVRFTVSVETALASTTLSTGFHWKIKLSLFTPNGITALRLAVVS